GGSGNKIVNILFDAVETAAQVVVVVFRQVGGTPALVVEDGQLADYPAQFQVGQQGMNALGEDEDAQQSVGLVEHAQQFKELAVALRLAFPADAVRQHQFGPAVEVLADGVKDSFQNPRCEGLPGVAAQQRRDVRLVELRHGVGPGRLLDTGNREHLI